MSLTRAQWLEMWESLNKISKLTNGIISIRRQNQILAEVAKMKEMVQQVVGQLE